MLDNDPEPTNQELDAAVTWASILFYLTGLLGTLGVGATVAYITYYRTWIIVFGIRAMDGSAPIGGFLGLDGVIVLGWLFVVVSALEIVAGYWLWKSLKKGGKLGIILLTLGIFFAVGFFLPIWLIVHPLQAILLAGSWKKLR